jgi:multicomponent Na+:H+ antiporter subunit D
LAFVWLNKKGLYPPELKSVNLDFEWVYRKAMPAAGLGLVRFADTLKTNFIGFAVSAVNALPVKKRGNDANAATLTLRMALGFVVLAVLAFVTQFI